jgi:hypothetical protein
MRGLRSAYLYQWLAHCKSVLLDSRYRAADRKARDEFRTFVTQYGGAGLAHDVRSGGGRIALIDSGSYLPFAKIEALVIKAFHLAGFDTAVVGNRRMDFMRYAQLAGNRRFLDAGEFGGVGHEAWAQRQAEALRDLDGWLALTFEGVHVGRFVVAVAMRLERRGRLDFADAGVRALLARALASSVRHVVGLREVLKRVRPSCVLVMDRGYAGHGEIFDLALQSGIDVITWHLGHRPGRLVFKRYSRANERAHPFSLSDESWQRLRALPWSVALGRAIRQEIFDCYSKEEWFAVVGTQFDKRVLSREAARARLGLDARRKVAVVFPHILWDGSFFFGEDLFDDYTHWLKETLLAAGENDRIQWVVKLHPAHLVKARQKSDVARPDELEIINQCFERVPDHIKIVPPDTELSTYSLFQVADYTITVRGTVGIESALFGIPVVTAGTGRYDRLGFTVDSSTREAYVATLGTLEGIPPLTPAQIELAERYAYGVFVCRPLRLSSVTLEFERDAIATPRLRIAPRSRRDWQEAPDMRRLAAWLAAGRGEDLFDLSETATGVVEPPPVEARPAVGTRAMSSAG